MEAPSTEWFPKHAVCLAERANHASPKRKGVIIQRILGMRRPFQIDFHVKNRKGLGKCWADKERQFLLARPSLWSTHTHPTHARALTHAHSLHRVLQQDWEQGKKQEEMAVWGKVEGAQGRRASLPPGAHLSLVQYAQRAHTCRSWAPAGSFQDSSSVRKKLDQGNLTQTVSELKIQMAAPDNSQTSEWAVCCHHGKYDPKSTPWQFPSWSLWCSYKVWCVLKT